MNVHPVFGLRHCLLLLLAGMAAAQTPPVPPTSSAPVPYSSVSELNMLLSQLEQSSQATQIDLAKLRIEKWKTDANTKHSTQSDVDSIQRNLQNALPGIVGELKNSPESLSSTFKLYRNLDALYDVFGSVVESAGAFGPRDDFQSLQNDWNALERARHSFADRMETLASTKEGELTRLRADLQAAQAAAVHTEPPKKVVIDDTEAPKPPVKKKSSAKSTKKPAPAAPGGNATTPQPAPPTPAPQ